MISLILLLSLSNLFPTQQTERSFKKQGGCNGLKAHVSLPPPNSYIENLFPKVIPLGGEGLWEVLSLGDGVLINGISALLKRPKRDHLSLQPCEDTAFGQHL